MTTLDEILMEQSKEQISQYEKTFDAIINQVISSFSRQITKDPFKEYFTVHVIHGNPIDTTLGGIVKHGQDQAKLLFYLTHYGIQKISEHATLQPNFGVDNAIKITYHNYLIC